jgi:hypothetical protein
MLLQKPSLPVTFNIKKPTFIIRAWLVLAILIAIGSMGGGIYIAADVYGGGLISTIPPGLI